MPQGEDYTDAVIIGAGWAGLSVSARLIAAGVRHRVIERKRIGETWRTQRWNTFRMNTPNVQTVMPGDVYRGNDPEGFLTRDQFVELLERFAARHHLPITTQTAVHKVTVNGSGLYDIETERGSVVTPNLVVATGNLNVPRRPGSADKLPDSVEQIDGADYREPRQLRPGAIVVVGSGNSGGQIAEDLAAAGRRVFLATGHNGRMPRRYRGRDITLWLAESGLFDVPSKNLKFAGRPLLGPGHTISLQLLSTKGILLMGRFSGVDHRGQMLFDDDVSENVRFGDEASAKIKLEIEQYIEARKIPAPPALPDPAESVAAQLPAPPIKSLDLLRSGVTSVIWCTGFVGDFSWLHVPGALRPDGQPLHPAAVSALGLYFAGLDFSETRKSGTILDAEAESVRISRKIISRNSGQSMWAHYMP
jgi:putative flavoprotein involved in K+ transport